MPEFRPVDYDPFGSDGSDGPALVPVDHDPFADDDEEVTLSAFPPVDLNAPVTRADPGHPVFMSVGDIGGVFDAPAPPPADPQEKLALPLSENFYPDTELKPYGFLDRIKNVFRRNRRNAFYTGGSTGLAVNALSGGQAYTRPELEGFEMSSLTPASDDPIGAIADRLAAGTGQLVGSIPHVESFLGPAGLAERQVAKMAIEGPIKQRIAQEAIENSIMNTVTDPAIQAANIASGLQDDYNPAQTAAAPVLGAAVGTATGAGFGTAGVMRERAAERRLDREAKASAQEQMAGVLDKIFLPPPEKMSSLPMSDAEIAIARKKMEPRQTGPAKLTPDQEKSLDRDFSRRERKINQAPPPERTYGDTVFGQEERLAQTRDDLPGQRDAAGAFRMADRQRERLAEQPGTLDTQAAGRPEGVNPQEVFLDQDFPVQIIDRRIVPDSRGRGVDVARVRRYDPRTGQPEPDSVEYEVEMRNLRRRQYTINPRQATDFQARAKGPRTPETPRMPNQDVRLEPEQTYRATAPDNNEQFPGAGMGRSPFPEQPEGPSRYRTESDAEAWFRAEQERRARGERTRAEQESEARAQEQYKGQKSTNTPRGKGDGRNWDVDEFGFVVSAKGGPVIFGDQKMAAKWILKNGQKDTDQIFEIYNHPSGKGFTVKERGRTQAPEPEAPDAPDAKASSDQPGAPRQLEQPGGRKQDEPPDNRPEDEITEENQGPEVDDAADDEGDRIMMRYLDGLPGKVKDYRFIRDRWAKSGMEGKVEPMTGAVPNAADTLAALHARVKDFGFNDMREINSSSAKDKPQAQKLKSMAASLAGRNSRFVSKLRKVITKAKDAEPDKIAAEHKELVDGIEEAEIFLDELSGRSAPDSRETSSAPAASPRSADEEFIPAFARKNAETDPKVAENPQKVAPDDENMQPDRYKDVEPGYFAPQDIRKFTADNLIAGKESIMLGDNSLGSAHFVINRDIAPDIAAAMKKRLPSVEKKPGARTKTGAEADATNKTVMSTFGGRLKDPKVFRALAAFDREGVDGVDVVGRFGDGNMASIDAPLYDYFVNQLGLEIRGMGPDQPAGLYKKNKLVGIMSVHKKSPSMDAEAAARAFEPDAMSPQETAAYREKKRPSEVRRVVDGPTQPKLTKEQEARAQDAKDDLLAQLDSIASRSGEAAERGDAPADDGPEAVLKRPSGGETRYKFSRDHATARDQASEIRAGASKMPRSRFYSNPFLDPFLMGDLLSTAGRKTLQLLQSEVKNWKVEARRVEKTLGSARDAKGFQNGLRQWAQMNSEVLRGLGKKYPGVKAFMQAHDALSTHPGSGRAIKEPFENAHQRKANHFSNRLANILGDHADDEKFMNALRDALTTGNARGGTETAMARNVAGLLREIHDYATAAGIKMGKVERFFPRWLDAEKVVADQEGFVKAATRQYQSEGMSLEDAGKAAQALYMNYAAPDSLFLIPSTMGPDSTQGRSWGPSADTTMRDYLVTDPSQVLFSYIDGMTYRAEWARRFGDDNKVIKDWLQSMAGKVSKEDINLFKDAILASTGRMRARLGTAGERALDALSLFGTMMNLKRVALTSIPEAINTGVMTGDALDGMGAFVESVGAFLGAGGKTEKDLRKFAEFIGAIGSAENEMMQLSRYGLDFGGAKARLRSRKFFLLNGLTRLTHKQRIRAVKYGRIFFEDLAESVLEGGKRADSALLALSDYGIAPADAPAFAKWLVKDNAGRPDVTALSSLSGNQNKAMGETYMGALTRFADQVIQNPKAVNKPYMAYHPRARGIYGLTSFYFSLEHNILHPAIRRLATSVKGRNPATGKQMDAGQRLALASSTLFPLLVTWAVTSAVFNAREHLTNKTQHEERSAATKALLSVGRPGWLGRLNQFTGLMDDMYFETEIPYMLLGPSISSPASDAGAIAQFFSNKNSPNTPAAERKALIGVYDLALAGLLYKLMPYAPVKGAAAVGAFGAMQTLGAPELRKKVGTDLAEELTGQEYKPRGMAQKQKKSAGSF